MMYAFLIGNIPLMFMTRNSPDRSLYPKMILTVLLVGVGISVSADSSFGLGCSLDITSLKNGIQGYLKWHLFYYIFQIFVTGYLHHLSQCYALVPTISLIPYN